MPGPGPHTIYTLGTGIALLRLTRGSFSPQHCLFYSINAFLGPDLGSFAEWLTTYVFSLGSKVGSFAIEFIHHPFCYVLILGLPFSFFYAWLSKWLLKKGILDTLSGETMSHVGGSRFIITLFLGSFVRAAGAGAEARGTVITQKGSLFLLVMRIYCNDTSTRIVAFGDNLSTKVKMLTLFLDNNNNSSSNNDKNNNSSNNDNNNKRGLAIAECEFPRANNLTALLQSCNLRDSACIYDLEFYSESSLENGHSSMYTWILSTGWWEGRAPLNPEAVLVVGVLCTSLLGGFIYINRVMPGEAVGSKSSKSIKFVMLIAFLYCVWCSSQIYWRDPPQPAVGEEADLGVLVFLFIYFFLPHTLCILSMNHRADLAAVDKQLLPL